MVSNWYTRTLIHKVHHIYIDIPKKTSGYLIETLFIITMLIKFKNVYNDDDADKAHDDNYFSLNVKKKKNSFFFLNFPIYLMNISLVQF